MQIDRGSVSQGQLIPLYFGQDAVAASQSDVQLPIAIGEGSQAVDGYTMPFDYAVVAISGDLSAAATAGSLQVGVTQNGTEVAASTRTITTATSFYKRFARNAIRGKAGTKIGAEITTGGTWDGTAADLGVTVWVILMLERI